MQKWLHLFLYSVLCRKGCQNMRNISHTCGRAVYLPIIVYTDEPSSSREMFHFKNYTVSNNHSLFAF